MSIECKIYTGGFAQTNGYLFEGKNGWILVDAPEGVDEWLGSVGVKLSALLLTHHHYDHVLGVAKLVRDHQCPVYAHSAYSRHLTLEALMEGAGMRMQVEPYVVTDLLAGRSRVIAAGMEFGLRYVPGHSVDSLVFVPQGESLAFVGDTVFAGGLGRSDFPGGSHPLLVSGIKEHILSLDGETRLLPGHGPGTTVAIEAATNPYLR